MTRYYVNTAALTLRGGPDSKAYVVGYLKQNDILESLDLSPDRYWRKVRTTAKQVGWCSDKYLSPLDAAIPSPQPSASPRPLGSFSVSPIVLFLRQEPGPASRVVGMVRRGEVVEGLDIATDKAWLKIRNKKEQQGWCASRYLTPLGTPVPAPSGTARSAMHLVIEDRLRLNNEPKTDSRLIGEMLVESIVHVSAFSTDGKWAQVSTNMGFNGWCQAESLQSLGEMTCLAQKEEFPWMPIAFGEIGTREYPGENQNPRVQEYLASTSLGEGYPDETHWCASFVNWCVERSGLASNNSPMAYSWSNWGQELKTPRRGCVVTFKWDDGGSHVAFYLGERGDNVLALGGNQADGVWIMAYPKRNVSACRIPKNWTGTG